MGPLLSLVMAAALASPHPQGGQPRGHARANSPAACGDVLSAQILLDRRGFSPGQIDGTIGANAAHALAAFQSAGNLQSTGKLDCDTWSALMSDTDPVTTTYAITEADAAGPFTETIPRDLVEQSHLAGLEYRSVLERLSERFHASPALLERLNPNVRFSAGQSITVPAVTPFDDRAKPLRDEAAGDVTIEVSRDDSSLRIHRSDGTLLFFAPVTTGSEHDPLPLGNWRVTSVDWRPAFHYNPDLFWDANPAHTKATIKPGPNNPVGVMWIGVSVEHYGIHGTPEPSTVGHTESHGCIRLTNWDAMRVASLARVGTPVVFK